MYLDKTDFLKELILSQGRGRISPKLFNYFWLISTNISSKFINNFGLNDYTEDQKAEAFLDMCEKYNYFDLNKYDDGFRYFSEIAKRSYTRVHNLINDRKQENNYMIIRKIKLHDFQNVI